MFANDQLTQEFVSVVEKVYPRTYRLLQDCHIRVINTYWGSFRSQLAHRLQYVVIYCPRPLFEVVQSRKAALRELALDMGLSEVVCLNADRLLRDPLSTMPHSDPRLWLELHWITTEA